MSVRSNAGTAKVVRRERVEAGKWQILRDDILGLRQDVIVVIPRRQQTAYATDAGKHRG
jgi:hypothetical protein